MQEHPSTRLICLLVLCALVLMLAACRVEPPANGWGIVAADPATGDVGVAAAACGSYPLDYRAVLDPGKGAGIALGVISPLQRDRVGEWIEASLPAQTVIARLKATDNDTQADVRQYAVVTLQKGSVDTALFTSAQVAQPNRGMQDAANAVAVVGTALQYQDVPKPAINAYRDSSVGLLALSDRLLRALEGGSQAGGVKECNQNGVVQTASTAFLMVARGGDPYFAVINQGKPASAEPRPPWLALSVIEPLGGRNAVSALREQYDAWRPQHLPTCADCNLAAITIPPGGTLTAPPNAWLQENALRLVIAFILLVAALTVIWFTLRPHSGHPPPVADSS